MSFLDEIFRGAERRKKEREEVAGRALTAHCEEVRQREIKDLRYVLRKCLPALWKNFQPSVGEIGHQVCAEFSVESAVFRITYRHSTFPGYFDENELTLYKRTGDSVVELGKAALPTGSISFLKHDSACEDEFLLLLKRTLGKE